MSSDSDSDPTPGLSAELSELPNFGYDIMHDVVAAISSTIFCSAYGIIFGLALYSIFRKGLRSRVAIIMLCMVVYLYLASVAQWAITVWLTLKLIHGLLMSPDDVPVLDRPALAAAKLAVADGTVLEALFVLNMIIGEFGGLGPFIRADAK
ncbi:hypothetical protein C8R45DRAFT_941880 [Mycena sanguinolenta]|nr:hypothetical protein C8R45DRAFT_941880 [Mycena sanguinolenta]